MRRCLRREPVDLYNRFFYYQGLGEIGIMVLGIRVIVGLDLGKAY